jgi:hypothetical protein
MYSCHSGELAFNNTIENVRSIPDIDARITGASAFGVHGFRVLHVDGKAIPL